MPSIATSFFEMLHTRQFRFLFAGGMNTAIGYLNSLIIFYFLQHTYNIITISTIISIINITFSFFTLKIFVFKTHGRWFYEYFRCYLANFTSIIIGIFLLWLFYHQLSIPFWLAQGMQIFISAIGLYIIHTKFTFKEKRSHGSGHSIMKPQETSHGK